MRQSSKIQQQQQRNQLLQSKIIRGPEEIKTSLMCLICERLMLETSICTQCEKAYCTFCTEQWNKEGQGCLYCDGQSFIRQKPEFYDSYIKQIKIDCPYTNNQIHQKCDRIQMSFNEAQEHIKTCQYEVFKCQNKDCVYEGLKQQFSIHKASCEFRDFLCIHCNEVIQHRFILEHDRICTKKQIKCPYCNSFIYQNEMESHQKNICSDVEEPCNYCKQNQQRRNLNIHRKQCPKKPVDCVCNKVFLQEQIEEHQKICPDIKISCENCNKTHARSEQHNNEECIKFLSSTCNQIESDVFLMNEQVREIRKFLRLPVYEDDNQFLSFIRPNQN